MRKLAVPFLLTALLALLAGPPAGAGSESSIIAHAHSAPVVRFLLDEAREAKYEIVAQSLPISDCLTRVEFYKVPRLHGCDGKNKPPCPRPFAEAIAFAVVDCDGRTILDAGPLA